MKELLKKLQSVQLKLKSGKKQYNNFGKYKYRSCEDILEDVKPLLLENGLCILIQDDVIFNEGRHYVKAIVKLYDIESGHHIESSAFAREEESKKGMDGSQVTGASSSYARKYALNGLFAIDDTKDSDATNRYDNYKKTEKTHINEDQKRQYLEKMKNSNSLEELKTVWSDSIPEEYRLCLSSEKDKIKLKFNENNSNG